VFARQRLLDKNMQKAFAESEIFLIGAGGLNAPMAVDFTRKGISHLTLIDHDTVDATNLSRTPFRPDQIGKNKAFALLDILKNECLSDTIITAWPAPAQRVLQNNSAIFDHADLVIVGVDNDDTRYFVSDLCLQKGIPMINLGVSATALTGSVFTQRTGGKPCFRCLRPESPDALAVRACVPASLDVNRVIGGLALYATTAILCGWEIGWNYYGIILTGEPVVSKINPLPGCKCAEVRA
jgi:adenylyltransferase/sulfurtransferase